MSPIDAPSNSLRAKALRAGIWLGVGNSLAKAANFLKQAVLAHLLAPNDFGIMGVALMALSCLEFFSETGFRSALVQKRDDVAPYLNTSWTSQVLRGFSLAGLLALLAPAIAQFFETSQAVDVIRATSIVVVLRGLTSPAMVYLQRELDFRKQMIWNVAGASVGLVVGVTAGLIHPSVWALLWSVVAAEGARTILSFVIVPYRPRLEFQSGRALELFHFGKWIFFLNVFTFLSLNIDSMAVGKWAGTEALGFYQVAYQCAYLVTLHLGRVLAGVMFPALSRVPTAERRSRAFLSATSVVMSLALFVALVLSTHAKTFVLLVYGERWLPIAPPLAVLAWAAAFASLSNSAQALFQASGQPRLGFTPAAARVVLMTLLLYPVTKSFGLMGTAGAVAASEATALVLNMRGAQRLLNVDLPRFASAVTGALYGALPLVIFALARPFISDRIALPVSIISIVLAGILVIRNARARILPAPVTVTARPLHEASAANRAGS